MLREALVTPLYTPVGVAEIEFCQMALGPQR
jgi:hypothetical protein